MLPQMFDVIAVILLLAFTAGIAIFVVSFGFFAAIALAIKIHMIDRSI